MNELDRLHELSAEVERLRSSNRWFMEILAALEKHGYDTKGEQMAAKELHISLSTLYNKLRLYKQQGEL